MAINELIEVKRVARESFNNEEIENVELSFFAMQLGIDESPQRFLKARITDVDGLLLITDERVIFVGKSTSGRRMGVDINYEDVMSVSVETNKFNKKLANLTITDEEEYYTFTVIRFGAENWANYIKDRI